MLQTCIHELLPSILANLVVEIGTTQLFGTFIELISTSRAHISSPATELFSISKLENDNTLSALLNPRKRERPCSERIASLGEGKIQSIIAVVGTEVSGTIEHHASLQEFKFSN